MTNTPEKFWARVEVGEEDECWEWQGAQQEKGHGQLRFRGSHWKAHRLAFFLENGSIPKGAFICHKCNNPPCCNPKHLYAGGRVSNARDAIEAGTFAWNGVGARGAKNSNSKLTAAAVRRVRRMLKSGKKTQKQIAAIVGCSQSNVSDISRGKIWSHVK